MHFLENGVLVAGSFSGEEARREAAGPGAPGPPRPFRNPLGVDTPRSSSHSLVFGGGEYTERRPMRVLEDSEAYSSTESGAQGVPGQAGGRFASVRKSSLAPASLYHDHSLGFIGRTPSRVHRHVVHSSTYGPPAPRQHAKTGWHDTRRAAPLAACRAPRCRPQPRFEAACPK